MDKDEKEKLEKERLEKEKALEKEEPEFKNIDEAVTFFKTEMESFKKLIKPDMSTREKKDEFKLYHEQMENKLKSLNEKVDGFEGVFNKYINKIIHTGGREGFDKVYDFFLKW